MQTSGQTEQSGELTKEITAVNMQTAATSDTEGTLYKYYNASGVYIGKSWGTSPDNTLFQKAHYVIQDETDMIKNLDPVHVVERDIERYRQELLHVPISNMAKIMELNHLIKNLERFLHKPAA